MPRGKIKYIIDDNEEDLCANELRGLVSMVRMRDYTIIARYGVNKNTLKKILKKWLKEVE